MASSGGAVALLEGAVHNTSSLGVCSIDGGCMRRWLRETFWSAFFKQKTAYEIGVRLVGSEMCIRDRIRVQGSEFAPVRAA